MRNSHRVILMVVYAIGALWVYLARASLPAYSVWVAAALIGLACWEAEPILKKLLGKQPMRKPGGN